MGEDLNLEPQNKIPSLIKALETLCVRTHSSIKIISIDGEMWENCLIENREKIQELKINDACLLPLDKKASYKWNQQDGLVTVIIINPESEITADEDGIDSLNIKGKWWGKAKDVQISKFEGFIEISFYADEEWPVVIKGGNTDPLSAYYLANIALSIGLSEFAEYWLQVSSMGNSHSGMFSYAMLLMDKEKHTEAIHWHSRCIMNFGDHQAGYCLAYLLHKGNSEIKDGPLAEYILCRLCTEKFPDAFTQLALLYINGFEGVRKDKEKAHSLLSIASLIYNDERATDLLSQINWEDISDQKPENNQKESEFSLIDIILGGATIGMIGVLGFFAWKRFNKK